VAFQYPVGYHGRQRESKEIDLFVVKMESKLEISYSAFDTSSSCSGFALLLLLLYTAYEKKQTYANTRRTAAKKCFVYLKLYLKYA
jgi:hypothetical protein